MKFMKWIERLKTVNAPFLSHHPLCSSFTEDLIQVKGWKICLGCAIAYPLAILVIICSIWLPYGNWGWEFLAMTGIPLGLLQLMSTIGLTKKRSLKIFIKILLGVGLGLTALFILKIPLPFPIRMLIFIAAAQLASIPAGLRSKNIKKKCEKCPYNAEWGSCPGYIGTNYNNGTKHDLPIMPAGNKPVLYPISKKQNLELPVRLR
ncbi:hypothetical protein OAI71_00430 [Marine Group III euryarchaeote]|nr:hypothetical protein [Marine Group III euryarchaeote]